MTLFTSQDLSLRAMVERLRRGLYRDARCEPGLECPIAHIVADSAGQLRLERSERIEEAVEWLESAQLQCSTIAASSFCMPETKDMATGLLVQLSIAREQAERVDRLQRFVLWSAGVDEKVLARGRGTTELVNSVRSLFSRWLLRSASATCAAVQFSFFISEADASLADQAERSAANILGDVVKAVPMLIFLSNDELMSLLSSVERQCADLGDSLSQVEYSSRDFAWLFNDCDVIFTRVKPGDKFVATRVAPRGGDGVAIELKHCSVVYQPRLEDIVSALDREVQSTVRSLIKQNLSQARTIRDRIMYGGTEPGSEGTRIPGQVVGVCLAFDFTRSINEALALGPPITSAIRGIEAVIDDYIKALMGCVERCRGNLTSADRHAALNLIVTSSHFVRLGQELVEAIKRLSPSQSLLNCFDWLKTMRVTWEKDELDGAGHVRVHHLSSTYTYGYVFNPTHSRLMTNPMTDRIFATVTTALKMHSGTVPMGAAGSGKTETIKDMCYLLGRTFTIINCGDQIGARTLETMLAGMVRSGCWLMFDELNRLELSMLAVLAQQLGRIISALQLHQDTMRFGDDEGPLSPTLKMRSGFAWLASMNPGYSGRTEIPPALTRCFRPVAVAIPPMETLYEVILYQNGFREGKKLGGLLVNFLTLCRTLLPSREHYDFGLRSARRIVTLAREHLQEPTSDMPSEELALSSAVFTFMSQIVTKADSATMNELLLVHFPLVRSMIDALSIAHEPSMAMQPSTSLQGQQSSATIAKAALQDELSFYYAANTLESSNTILSKVAALCSSLDRKNRSIVGVATIGKTQTGKSTAIRAAHAMRQSFFNAPVKVVWINPKAMSADQLYGWVDAGGSEFRDGVLSRTMRSKEPLWHVLEGPVDAIILEQVNTLLDDNRVLCLVNGERIQPGEDYKFIIDTEGFDVVSPASVSRVTTLIFETATCFSSRGAFDKALDMFDLSTPLSSSRDELFIMFERGVATSPQLQDSSTPCPSPVALVKLFLQLARGLLQELRLTEVDEGDMNALTRRTVKDECAMKIGAFSFLWTFAGHLSGSLRERFVELHSPFLWQQFPRCRSATQGTSSLFDVILRRTDAGAVEEAIAVSSPRLLLSDARGQGRFFLQTAQLEAITLALTATCKGKSLLLPLLVGSQGCGKSTLATLLHSADSQTTCRKSSYCVRPLNSAPDLVASFIRSAVMSDAKRAKVPVPKMDESSKEKQRWILLIDDVHTSGKSHFGSCPPLEVLIAAFELRHVVCDGQMLDLPPADQMSLRLTASNTSGLTPKSPLNAPRLVSRTHRIYVPTMPEASLLLVAQNLFASMGSSLSGELAEILKQSHEIARVAISSLRPEPRLSEVCKVIERFSSILQIKSFPRLIATKMISPESVLDAMWRAAANGVAQARADSAGVPRVRVASPFSKAPSTEDDAIFVDAGRSEDDEDVLSLSECRNHLQRALSTADREQLVLLEPYVPQSWCGAVLQLVQNVKLSANCSGLSRPIGVSVLTGQGSSGKRSIVRCVAKLMGLPLSDLDAGSATSLWDAPVANSSSRRTLKLIMMSLRAEGEADSATTALLAEINSRFKEQRQEQSCVGGLGFHFFLCAAPGRACARLQEFPALANDAMWMGIPDWPRSDLKGLAEHYMSTRNLAGTALIDATEGSTSIAALLADLHCIAADAERKNITGTQGSATQYHGAKLRTFSDFYTRFCEMFTEEQTRIFSLRRAQSELDDFLHGRGGNTLIEDFCVRERQQVTKDEESLTKRSVISAACVTYLGPWDSAKRRSLLQEWLMAANAEQPFLAEEWMDSAKWLSSAHGRRRLASFDESLAPTERAKSRSQIAEQNLHILSEASVYCCWPLILSSSADEGMLTALFQGDCPNVPMRAVDANSHSNNDKLQAMIEQRMCEGGCLILRNVGVEGLTSAMQKSAERDLFSCKSYPGRHWFSSSAMGGRHSPSSSDGVLLEASGSSTPTVIVFQSQASREELVNSGTIALDTFCLVQFDEDNQGLVMQIEQQVWLGNTRASAELEHLTQQASALDRAISVQRSGAYFSGKYEVVCKAMASLSALELERSVTQSAIREAMAAKIRYMADMKPVVSRALLLHNLCSSNRLKSTLSELISPSALVTRLVREACATSDVAHVTDAASHPWQQAVRRLTTLFVCSVSPSLSKSHRISFQAMLQSEIAMAEGRLSKHEWSMIVFGLPYAPTPQDWPQAPGFVEGSDWVCLAELEKAYPSLRGTAKLISCSGSNIWESFLATGGDRGCDGVVGPSGRALTPIEQLLLVRCLRKSQCKEALTRWMAQQGDFDLANDEAGSEANLKQMIASIQQEDGMRCVAVVHAANDERRTRNIVKSALTDCVEIAFTSMEADISMASISGRKVALCSTSLFPDQFVQDFVDKACARLTTSATSSSTTHPKSSDGLLKLVILVSDKSSSTSLGVLRSLLSDRRAVVVQSDPPTGIRENASFLFRHCVNWTDDKSNEFGKFETLSRYSKEQVFKKLVYALSIFHGVIISRRQLGCVGFQCTYDWSSSDFTMSVSWLATLVRSASRTMAWEPLTFIVASVIYGGCIGVSEDLVRLTTIFRQYCNAQALADGHIYEPKAATIAKDYCTPNTEDLSQLFNMLEQLPTVGDCGFACMGFEEPARDQICFAESTILLDTLRRSWTAAEGIAATERIAEIKKWIPAVDLLQAQASQVKKQLTLGNDAYPWLSICRGQEMERYLTLATNVHAVLENISENEISEILSNSIPDRFLQRSSILMRGCDSLAQWLRLVEQGIALFVSLEGWRLACLQKRFPIPQFFAPAAFLSCVSLDYSRIFSKSLEELKPSLVLGIPPEASDERVITCTGLRAIGWRWDKAAGKMTANGKFFSNEELPPVPYAPAHLRPSPMAGSGEEIIAVPFAATRASVVAASANIVPDLLAISTEPATKWALLGASHSVYHR